MLLECQQEVDISHDALIEALLHIINKTFPDDAFRFPKMISMIAHMRTITQQYDSMMDNLSIDYDNFPSWIVEGCLST